MIQALYRQLVETRKIKEMGFPIDPPEETQPCRHLDFVFCPVKNHFNLWPLQTVRWEICAVLNHCLWPFVTIAIGNWYNHSYIGGWTIGKKGKPEFNYQVDKVHSWYLPSSVGYCLMRDELYLWTFPQCLNTSILSKSSIPFYPSIPDLFFFNTLLFPSHLHYTSPPPHLQNITFTLCACNL